MPPVVQQPGRLRRYLPLIRARMTPPDVHLAANGVDEPRRIISLRVGGRALVRPEVPGRTADAEGPSSTSWAWAPAK